MEISRLHNNIQFTSKCNPIAPSKLRTHLGEVRIFEPSSQELENKKFTGEIVDFWADNFSKDTNDPAWLRFQKPEYADEFQKFKNRYAQEIQDIVQTDDGHTTFLVARNNQNKLCGAIMTHGFNDLPHMKKLVMYIANIATDKAYRNSGLGKTLINKVIEAEQNYYTDVFLVGENNACGFYRKLGFQELDKSDKTQKPIMRYMESMRFDYPNYVTLFTKPIQINKPRWFEKASEIIKSFGI